MKNKVVVWGTNSENEKVLIALELQAESNKVMLYTFPEAVANEEFVTKMMNEWREGKPVEFPETHTTLERELSVADSLLPDELKVERGDVITRAQTEWHFAVLSSKLHTAYQQELADFKEKVAALSAYDGKVWDSLKGFWDKVQNQSRERNLFKQHADELRDNINALFNDLKTMRTKVKSEFEEVSQKVYDEFNESLNEIDERIAAGGAKLNSVLEDLKKMQRQYRESRMTNEHRNKLWDRLDGAFKAAKERKFGPGANEGSVVERHDRRLHGLLDAIKRMEDSVRRDEEELNFQRKKVNATEGQLEAQIRMAKIKMIEERLSGKRERLAEMNKTRSDVERQSTNAKEKEVKRAEKESDRQKFEAAKEAAKAEIAAGIKTSKSATPAKEDSLFEAATNVLGDVLLDALDTVKAVASVAAEKAEAALEVAAEKADEVIEVATEKVQEIAEAMKKEKEEQVEDAGEAVVEKAEDVAEKVADAAEDATTAAEEEKKADA
jgi:gas vesicle protein